MISKENNFDFLRLLLASLVIVSHSYPLSGFGNYEILANFSEKQIDFGSLAVNCFFIISGYLILISLQRSRNIIDYSWKRLLRLFPALIALLIITMLFLPFIYKGTQEHIFQEESYWSYFFRNLSLYHIQFNISGIFETNPFRGMINGSLWTLCYEFTMYFILVPLFWVKNQKKLLIIIIGSVFILSYILSLFFPNFYDYFFQIVKMKSSNFYRLSSFFLAGSLMVFLNQKFLMKREVLLISLLVSLLTLYYGGFTFLSPVVLPFLVIGFGLRSTKYISNLSHRIGDLSYGIYIYGFLVQQTLMYLFELQTYSLMLFSLIITIILSYFSWHYIERVFLRYKNRFV